MDGKAFARQQRSHEWFGALTMPPGVWSVVRLDGRSFSRLTAERYAKPFDARFAEMMADTAQTLFSEFEARYATTHSDEISLTFAPEFSLFAAPWRR